MIANPPSMSNRELPAFLGFADLADLTVESLSHVLGTNEFAPGALSMVFALLPYGIHNSPELLRLGLLHPDATASDWISLLSHASRREVYHGFTSEQKSAFPPGVARIVHLKDTCPDSAWKDAFTYVTLAYPMEDHVLETFRALVSEASFKIDNPGQLFCTIRDAALALAA